MIIGQCGPVDARIRPRMTRACVVSGVASPSPWAPDSGLPTMVEASGSRWSPRRVTGGADRRDRGPLRASRSNGYVLREPPVRPRVADSWCCCPDLGEIWLQLGGYHQS
jgi:hypothetical protein